MIVTSSATRSIFLCVALILLLGMFVHASPQEHTDKELEALKKKQEIAEIEKAIAEANKAKVEALFPKPDAAALVGGTTVKADDFIESRILGYCAMKSVAKRISVQINPTLGVTPIGSPTPNTSSTPTLPIEEDSTLVVYSEEDIKMLARYASILRRLQLLEKGYREIAAGRRRTNCRSTRPGYQHRT